jgi:cellulose biosynthesis protein BcsQ
VFFFVWAAKGGSGATVTSVGLASTLARASGSEVLLVDLAGDVPAALGVPEPRHGVSDWLAAPGGPGPDALARLEVDRNGLSVLGMGRARGWPADREQELARLLSSEHRHVVVDGGLVPATADAGRLASTLLDAADRSVLVVRSCYLGLRRAIAAGRRTDVVVLVREVGRSMVASDIRAVLGVERIVEIDLDPLVARAVDSGLLAERGHRFFARSLRRVA